MAAYQESLSVSSNHNCVATTVTITDTSNLGNNDQGLTIEDVDHRSVLVQDMNSNILGTGTIANNTNSITIDISASFTNGILPITCSINTFFKPNPYFSAAPGAGLGTILTCILN